MKANDFNLFPFLIEPIQKVVTSFLFGFELKPIAFIWKPIFLKPKPQGCKLKLGRFESKPQGLDSNLPNFCQNFGTFEQNIRTLVQNIRALVQNIGVLVQTSELFQILRKFSQIFGSFGSNLPSFAERHINVEKRSPVFVLFTFILEFEGKRDTREGVLKKMKTCFFEGKDF